MGKCATLQFMNLSSNHNIFLTAGFEVCPELGQVKQGEQSIRLGPVNMRVLLVLLENHGRVVSRTELFEQVWKNQIVSDDTLTRCISDLRGQLGRHIEQIKLIETIPKRGYRWTAEVSQKKNRLEAKSDGMMQSNSQKAEVKHAKPTNQWKLFSIWLLSGVILLLILSTSVLWMVKQTVNSDTVRVALLPMQVENEQQRIIATNFEDLLKEQLLATENIRFLSSRTLDGNRQNLYPYLSRKFAAQWIIEGRIRDNHGKLKIILNLVDARTALVAKSFARDYAPNHSNFKNLVISLGKELESSLTVD